MNTPKSGTLHLLSVLLMGAIPACGDDTTFMDSSLPDGGSDAQSMIEDAAMDAGRDVGRPDAGGNADSGASDAGALDSGPADVGVPLDGGRPPSAFPDNEYGPVVEAGQVTAGGCPNIPATFPNATRVTTYAEFEAAYAAAGPGDAVIIADGDRNWRADYPAVEGTPWVDSGRPEEAMFLDRDGTEGAPIYVISESVHGARLGRGFILMTGRFNVLAGFMFDNGGRVLSTNADNRAACNYFRNGTGYIQAAARGESPRFEMDNNVIDGANAIGVVFYTCNPANRGCTDQSRGHHIHHNLWTNQPFTGENGHDAIFLGLNYSPVAGTTTYTDHRMDALVENNLFDGWNGEEELISIKSDGHIIRNNCVLGAPQSNIFLRDGDDVLITGNWIHGRDRGLQFSGERSVVAFNYVSTDGQYGFRMYPLIEYTNNDTGQFGTYRYIGAKDGVFTHNVFSGMRHLVAAALANWRGLVSHPSGNVIRNNHVYSDSYMGTTTAGGYLEVNGVVSESEFRANNTWGVNEIVPRRLTDSFCGDPDLFDGPGGPDATIEGHAGLTGGAQTIHAPSWW